MRALRFIAISALLFSFICSQKSYAKTLLPDVLEKGDLEKALPLMQNVVDRYERARKAYRKKGPQFYVDSLSEKLSKEDKKEILQLLSKLPELPHLSIKAEELVFEFEDQSVLNFKIADVILGKFKSDGFSKRYNFNLSPGENWKAFQVKNKPKDYSYRYLLDALKEFLLPRAYAYSKISRDIGLVSVGALTQAVVLPRLGYVDYAPRAGSNH
ncbi:MAG: hypothetical protein R3A80_12535 [Bdellovibrionota bacterium]